MNSSVDYSGVLLTEMPLDYQAMSALLGERLPRLWLDAYCATCSHDPSILQITIGGFEHLFDFTSDPLRHETGAPEDRLVAVYGLSQVPDAGRDVQRMRGFLGRGLTGSVGTPRDKGHFIAHSAGGCLDINLFPQRSELNRGRSEEGKVFRRMERFAAENPGTFVFARPIYADASWSPAELEYGVLLPHLRLWVQRFPN